MFIDKVKIYVKAGNGATAQYRFILKNSYQTVDLTEGTVARVETLFLLPQSR